MTNNGTFAPRLVALDIDGTLVDANGVLPEDLRNLVHDLAASGMPVVLSTGRSWVSTAPVFDALDLPPGPAVVSNGAMVVSYPPLQVLHEERFDPAPTLTRVQQLLPQARVAVQDGLDWRVSEFFPDGELDGEVHVETWDELASRPVSRIVIRDPEGTEDEFLSKVADLGLHEVAYFVGWSAWLDIAPQGVDKAHGLQRVIDPLGLSPTDVLAIGDGRNDIEMLQWAGRGVAMGNAPDDVKAVADHVTGTFADGGTAAELRRWF